MSGVRIMKNKLVIVTMLALIAALLVPAAWSQSNCTVRGTVKGEDGKPIPGVKVQYYSADTGRKYVIQTDKSGVYYSISVVAGTYKVSLLDADNKPLYPEFFVMAQVSIQNQENIADVDLKKARAQSGNTMTDEQKKKIEAQKHENEKIKGLNEKLVLSKTQQDQGQFEEAVKTMEEAAQLDATRDLIWFKLADAYLMAGKKNPDKAAGKEEFQKAVDAYKKAIAIKPTVGAYYNNMGEAYAKLGQTDGAIEAYTQAAMNDPTEAAKYYFNLGAVLTNTGKADEANAAFDKAIAADPTKADAYYQKSINLMSKGTVDAKGETHYPPEVASGLQKYLELSPTGPYADGAKALLASMGEKVQTTFGTPKTGKKK
jgi:tetratricopeptide (TPR) repeat protein